MTLPVNEIMCGRCGVRLRVDGSQNSQAKMLRRAKQPKGLCVNCAVHDWLRNIYPVNMLLAESGPKGLALPHIQEQFAGIMRVGMADALPDEISWELIIENWDLPFPHKIKTTGANPCSQDELEAITAGKHPGIGSSGRPSLRQIAETGTITGLEQLNELEPGLGDDLRECLDRE